MLRREKTWVYHPVVAAFGQPHAELAEELRIIVVDSPAEAQRVPEYFSIHACAVINEGDCPHALGRLRCFHTLPELRLQLDVEVARASLDRAIATISRAAPPVSR